MAQVWKKETPEEREEVVVTRSGHTMHQERFVEHTGLARREAAYSITQLLWLLFGILEGLIVLRFLLKLIAANPANPFADLVYQVTDIFLWPFYGLTETPSVDGIVLEIPSVIALIVYAFISWVLVKIVWLLLYRSPSTHVVETYDEDVR
jgi:hypothetical protein